ncbi:hypothetical protein ACH4UM_26660 [Streptomyces sp. NPDC020801]|uniref:hypothetical protein n=1 Tax=unclassified Streptomyces TaxID=2593676 RepID=UPI0037BD74A2
MIPAMPAAATARRSRQARQSRRSRQASSAGRASSVALRFGRVAAMGTVAALILIAGVWASWETAPYVMLTKGRERGTIEVVRCGGATCSGPYTPISQGSASRGRVVIAHTVAVKKGRTYTVVVKPGTDEVVRSGPAGILYAWAPLGGALLLSSVVVAGGLRRTRAAWVLAGSGVALLTAAFVVL